MLELGVEIWELRVRRKLEIREVLFALTPAFSPGRGQNFWPLLSWRGFDLKYESSDERAYGR
jgi:hypothetical protein